jgi:RecA-family ATPase
MTLARPMFPPVDSSRRGFLAQAAAVAAGGAAVGMALPLPVSAGDSGRVPDPILGLIEAHKAAHAVVCSAVDRHVLFERELQANGRLQQHKRNEDERRQEAKIEAAIEQAHDAETDAACALVTDTLQNALLVMTGRTPHERGHPYFRFSGVVTEAAQQKAANVALKTLLDTDDVDDACRLMRLAGCINYPSDDKRERGYVPELVTLHIRKDAPAYTVEQLTGLTGKTSNPFGFDFNGTAKPGRNDDELMALLEASRIPGKWHNSMRAAIATMIGRGWSDSAIKLACAQYCKGGADDPDLAPLINGARKKYDKPDEEAAPGAKDYSDEFGPAQASAPPPQPLQWLDMSNWDGEPVPERQWAIRDRVPLNQVGLFSGEGGTGKSIVELMKNIAHVAGKDWLDSLPEPGPTFYLGAEDDTDELHIRLAAIAKHYDVTFEELIKGGMHVLPLLGRDATLCALNPKTGRVETTDLYRQIYERAGDLKPKNISVDTLSRAFAGNEIDRSQVYAFAMHMQALAMVANGSVTVLSHPSLQGIASGSGISGSTAWHGAFRFRQYLKGVKCEEGEQPENNLRELEFKKNQYGPLGESIPLHYKDGLFLPVAGASGLDKLARESRADMIFMDLLRRFADQGQNVSHKKPAPNYAPAAFARETEAKAQKFRKSELEDAMRRLFAANRIMIETYGRPSQPSSKLAVKPFKEKPDD